jgi:hypothetical protein
MLKRSRELDAIQNTSTSYIHIEPDLIWIRSNISNLRFDVCLSSAVIQNIVTDHIQEDFEFFVDSQRSNCARIMTEGLSARVPHAVEFPLKEAESLDGIMSYLTRKHGGNVHDKGIVTITSKSVDNCDPRNLAYPIRSLTSQHFQSKNEPDQWICWDFHKMCVCPTHYTINSLILKSSVVESSLDGEAWTEIDRQTDTQDFQEGWATSSFAVSKSAKCRFIRLTQPGRRRDGYDFLIIMAFEFFGILFE